MAMAWNIVSDQPDRVVHLYEALHKAIHPRVLPQPKCSGDQSLTFEWHKGGRHLTLEADLKGYLTYCFRDTSRQFFASNDYPMSYRSLELIREYLLPFAT
jgi:hypothetical protein